MPYPSRTLILIAASALLGACASVPKVLQGRYTNISVDDAQQNGLGDTQVRWGGQIIKTTPGPQNTCFYVLARPLDSAARPRRESSSQSLGRFVACRPGFYDPAIFAKGRDLTVTGTLHGVISRKVGGYEYAYPRVEAKVIYLWPKRPVYVSYAHPYGFYYPFWGIGWEPWGYGSYHWALPPVIVIHTSPADKIRGKPR